MISIKKDFGAIPQKLVDSDKDKRIKEALIQKKEHDFSSTIYRGKTIDALQELYHHKCGYCETDTTAGAPLQVEHYRPKAKVTEDVKHLGYYWLAYEWSNLTLGCSACNSAKGSKFPIVGTRLYDPEINPIDGLPTSCLISSKNLLDEKSLILNPEIDEVEKHLIFLPNGETKGLTAQGLKTI